MRVKKVMSESARGEASAAAATLDAAGSWREAAEADRAPAQAAVPSPYPLYPVALKLEGRLAVVVGGGEIAHRKTTEILKAGARVWAIAPEWPADFESLEADPETGGRLLRVTRRFTAGDLVGAFLVVAATDDVPTQRAVARAAEAQGVLCNVVDVNDLCSFYVPATLRRGSLAIAVQTDGKFPLLAVALRDRLARLIGPDFGAALERLAEARAEVRSLFPDDAGRRVGELKALFPDEALDLLLAERFDEFETRIASWRKGRA
jgi:precorrin-2 dehydrogenase/sirohydrochlorin ferrochelatase